MGSYLVLERGPTASSGSDKTPSFSGEPYETTFLQFQYVWGDPLMIFKKLISYFCLGTVLFLTPYLRAESGEIQDNVCPGVSGFEIIGETEYVTLLPENLGFKARIDTGAQTSSIGVANQQPFERDGKKWLKFSINDPASAKLVILEKPLIRIATIKRHGAEALERPVVLLKIKLGRTEMEREFTLADRSQFEFPLLVGRNVLTGKYLVDVNRRYSAQRVGVEE